MIVCFIHFHHVHSHFLGVRSSLPEPHNCIFVFILLATLLSSALGSHLVCLMVVPVLIKDEIFQAMFCSRSHKYKNVLINSLGGSYFEFWEAAILNLTLSPRSIQST